MTRPGRARTRRSALEEPAHEVEPAEPGGVVERRHRAGVEQQSPDVGVAEDPRPLQRCRAPVGFGVDRRAEFEHQPGDVLVVELGREMECVLPHGVGDVAEFR